MQHPPMLILGLNKTSEKPIKTKNQSTGFNIDEEDKLMPIIEAASSFSDFKAWLKKWLAQNRNAVQLDGSSVEKNNPEVYATMELKEIEGLTAKVAFHGDTKIDALKKMEKSKLHDFVIVPPKQGAKYWRFHFRTTHNYSNSQASDGLYAYLKKVG